MESPDTLLLPRALLHAASDVILVSGEEGHVVLASDQFRQVFGADPSDLLGQRSFQARCIPQPFVEGQWYR